jgi:hypothetical protein
MKRTAFLTILFAVTVAGLFAQAAALPRLAVAPFSTNDESVRSAATAVRDMVQSHMAGMGRYRMVTYDEIDLLLRNQQIQVSSIASAENIQKLQRTNINYIVTGSVNVLFGEYTIIVSLLDVSSGEYPFSARADSVGGSSREFTGGVNDMMNRFTAGMVTQGDRVTTNRTYNVGDIGPAGGIVFYNKGNNNDGWRYLEAAPANTEFTALWGAMERTISGTQTGIGTGKRNTQLIVSFLGSSENGRASQLCVQLNIGGYSDWFLPSKDELNLIYINLAQKGLGGFGGNWYWSSSQIGSYIAWNQSLSDGSQSDSSKNGSYSVRAVRAF